MSALLDTYTDTDTGTIALNVVHVVVSIDGQGQPSCPDANVTAKNTIVYWTFDASGAGYTFDDPAISFGTQPNDFPYPSWTQAPAIVCALFDRCHIAGQYDYSINVIAPSGAKLRVDPVIKNGNTVGGGGG
jgi:hypothetical protein